MFRQMDLKVLYIYIYISLLWNVKGTYHVKNENVKKKLTWKNESWEAEYVAETVWRLVACIVHLSQLSPTPQDLKALNVDTMIDTPLSFDRFISLPCMWIEREEIDD
jgi:hypothetical protein